MRTSRTPEDWKVLRRVAVELLQDGMTQEAVVERLQVSRSSIILPCAEFEPNLLLAP